MKSLTDIANSIALKGSAIPNNSSSGYLQRETYMSDDCDCYSGDCSDCVCTDCNECGND